MGPSRPPRRPLWPANAAHAKTDPLPYRDPGARERTHQRPRLGLCPLPVPELPRTAARCASNPRRCQGVAHACPVPSRAVPGFCATPAPPSPAAHTPLISRRASSAARLTEESSSSRACVRAGVAGRAFREPRACADFRRTSTESSPSAAINAGTAPGCPKRPNAQATSARTGALSLLSFSIKAETISGVSTPIQPSDHAACRRVVSLESLSVAVKGPDAAAAGGPILPRAEAALSRTHRVFVDPSDQPRSRA